VSEAQPRRSFWGVSFTNAAAPRGAEGRLALELQFKVARSTVDFVLAMFRPVANNSRDRSLSSNSRVTAGNRQPPMGDSLEYKIGAMQVDITTAPYGGEPYPYRHSTSNRRLNSRVS
jgi:hypothetical protein